MLTFLRTSEFLVPRVSGCIDYSSSTLSTRNALVYYPREGRLTTLCAVYVYPSVLTYVCTSKLLENEVNYHVWYFTTSLLGTMILRRISGIVLAGYACNVHITSMTDEKKKPVQSLSWCVFGRLRPKLARPRIPVFLLDCTPLLSSVRPLLFLHE